MRSGFTNSWRFNEISKRMWRMFFVWSTSQNITSKISKNHCAGNGYKLYNFFQPTFYENSSSIVQKCFLKACARRSRRWHSKFCVCWDVPLHLSLHASKFQAKFSYSFGNSNTVAILYKNQDRKKEKKYGVTGLTILITV